MSQRVKLLVKGRVQGVGFRYFTVWEAKKLNLKGCVKNLFNGSQVEIIAEGNKEDIEKMINIIKKGPSLANVDNVDISEEVYTGEFKDFNVGY